MESTSQKYDYLQFWESRLNENWDLVGVGHMGYSARYNRWLYRAQSRAIERLLKSAGIQLDNKDVLDVGSGIGYWLDWYHHRNVSSLHATELSRDACSRLESEFPEVVVQQGDITKSDWSPGTFDLVNVISVMYHIVEPDLFETAIKNIAGGVKPGGWLVVSDFLGDTEQNLSQHVSFHPLAAYEHQLDELGFKIDKVEPMYTLLNGGLSTAARRFPSRVRGVVKRFENLGAPLLYAIDSLQGISRFVNMRAIAAQKRSASPLTETRPR